MRGGPLQILAQFSLPCWPASLCALPKLGWLGLESWTCTWIRLINMYFGFKAVWSHRSSALCSRSPQTLRSSLWKVLHKFGGGIFLKEDKHGNISEMDLKKILNLVYLCLYIYLCVSLSVYLMSSLALQLWHWPSHTLVTFLTKRHLPLFTLEKKKTLSDWARIIFWRLTAGVALPRGFFGGRTLLCARFKSKGTEAKNLRSRHVQSAGNLSCDDPFLSTQPARVCGVDSYEAQYLCLSLSLCLSSIVALSEHPLAASLAETCVSIFRH